MKKVLLPSRMVKEIEDIVREDRHLGYVSSHELIRDAVRKYLMEYRFYKQRLQEDDGEDDDEGDGPLSLQPIEGYQ